MEFSNSCVQGLGSMVNFDYLAATLAAADFEIISSLSELRYREWSFPKKWCFFFWGGGHRTKMKESSENFCCASDAQKFFFPVAAFFHCGGTENH